MTPEERIAESFRLTEEYMRSIAAMSEAERQQWREARKREDDQWFGPPIPIAELLRANSSAEGKRKRLRDDA
jgi:hypothetical protein